MTTEFETKKQALDIGATYAGVYSEDKDVFEGVSPEDMELSWPHEKTIELYKIKNHEDIEVGIGIGEFRNGFDLWLVDLKNGRSQRV